MEFICTLSAYTLRENGIFLLIITGVIILFGIGVYLLAKRFGLDKFNNGDDDLLTPEDFFNHAADPRHEQEI